MYFAIGFGVSCGKYKHYSPHNCGDYVIYSPQTKKTITTSFIPTNTIQRINHLVYLFVSEKNLLFGDRGIPPIAQSPRRPVATSPSRLNYSFFIAIPATQMLSSNKP
jgi:hypothetical protein